MRNPWARVAGVHADDVMKRVPLRIPPQRRLKVMIVVEAESPVKQGKQFFLENFQAAGNPSQRPNDLSPILLATRRRTD